MNATSLSCPTCGTSLTQVPSRYGLVWAHLSLFAPTPPAMRGCPRYNTLLDATGQVVRRAEVKAREKEGRVARGAR